MAAKKTQAQLIKNPAWRSKVSDKALKTARPDLYQKRLAARKIAQENATLYNPSAILSGSALRGAVKGLVDADINPQLSAYDRAIGTVGAQTTARQAVSNEAYDRVQAGLSRTATAATEGTARAVGTQADIQKRTVDAEGAQGQQQQDYLARLAQNIGVDTGGAQQLAAQTAQLQGQATQTGATRQNQAAQLGAGYEGLVQAMAGAAQLQRGEASSRIGAKGQSDMSDLMGKRTDVAASRGPLTTKYATDLRQTMFTNEAAAKNFNLNVQKVKNDVVTDAARTKIAAGNLDVAKQNANTRNRQVTAGIQQGLDRIKISQQNADTNQRNSEKGVGANGKDQYDNTVKQRRDATDAFSKAKILAKPAAGSFKNDPDGLADFLVSTEGGGLNPTMARAAAYQIQRGYVGDNVYQQLKERGVASGFNTKAQKLKKIGRGTSSLGDAAARAHGYRNP